MPESPTPEALVVAVPRVPEEVPVVAVPEGVPVVAVPRAPEELMLVPATREPPLPVLEASPLSKTEDPHASITAKTKTTAAMAIAGWKEVLGKFMG